MLAARRTTVSETRTTAAPIPVGIVGGGKHGARYVEHIRRDVPELRVVELCRRDPVAGLAQADAIGARFVADARELARSPRIEAVIAVAPPTLNVAIAESAAAAGKALLIEKPLAMDVRAAAAIRAAARRAGVPAMVAHTLRFDSVVRAVCEARERIGAIHQVCLTQRFEPSPLSWLDDPAVSGGGNLLHTGVHGFDLLRFLTARDPQAASAALTRVVTRRTEDDFAAVFSFAEPLVGSVAGSRATAGRSGTIEVAGERGQIFADHVRGFAELVTASGRAPLAVGERVPTVRETLRAFVRVLRGEPAPITLDDGAWAVAMAEACYRSAESGRREPVFVEPE